MFGVGDVGLDIDRERRGLKVGDWLEGLTQPTVDPDVFPGPALQVPRLVGRGPNQATPTSFPKSLGKSGESVAAMNSS